MRRPRFGGRLELGNARTRAESDVAVEDRRRPKQPTVAELEIAFRIREKSLRGLLVRMGGQTFAADAIAGAFAFHVCKRMRSGARPTTSAVVVFVGSARQRQRPGKSQELRRNTMGPSQTREPVKPYDEKRRTIALPRTRSRAPLTAPSAIRHELAGGRRLSPPPNAALEHRERPAGGPRPGAAQRRREYGCDQRERRA